MVRDFDSLQSLFYHYMITEGGLAKKTSCDYISRLKYLTDVCGYKLDSDMTSELIDEIMNLEEVSRLKREKYSTKHAMGDFRAGLNKFLAFLKSDYCKKYEDSVLAEINAIKNNTDLLKTEKEAIVLSRIGQGEFRKRLIDYWHGCAVSSCRFISILVASHIKPWRDSDNEERLDVYNGLLLLPNYDKLFDLGYMTFDLNGNAVFSRLISKSDIQILRLNTRLRLINIESSHKKYLKYHNENCFIE
ncbi:HNH endonuclease [Marseilla massiliensis]|jgi:putative restriction endonuclease|uniref:HNH endonuclease n=1 Tax=Marseilla massiliensis TaxID=1841864 RepID=A0A939B6D1_9BACT|nr:HNH endonuclease [Marseilla massiliensis]MBM6672417.1 HNH endonuclease [Marseilla massiliensis]